MHILKIVATFVSLTFLAGSLSFAKDHRGERDDRHYKDNRGNNGRGPQDQGNRGRGPRDRDDNDRHDDDRRPDRREQRGAGPDHQFHKGSKLPAQYRQKIYVVNNWHYHQLPPPPRGHQWVQTGADYVLVAIATGVIVQLILNGIN